MNVQAALFLVSVAAFFMALASFVTAVAERRAHPDKPRKCLEPTLWGFAFLALGCLGNHFLAR